MAEFAPNHAWDNFEHILLVDYLRDHTASIAIATKARAFAFGTRRTGRNNHGVIKTPLPFIRHFSGFHFLYSENRYCHNSSVQV